MTVRPRDPVEGMFLNKAVSGLRKDCRYEKHSRCVVEQNRPRQEFGAGEGGGEEGREVPRTLTSSVYVQKRNEIYRKQ
jgi:hypothetical protein